MLRKFTAVFLTRLVQNLTLRNDCNLIPSAHRSQHLSSQVDHWTKGFTSPKVSYSKGSVKCGVERCTAFAVSIGSPLGVLKSFVWMGHNVQMNLNMANSTIFYFFLANLLVGREKMGEENRVLKAI